MQPIPKSRLDSLDSIESDELTVKAPACVRTRILDSHGACG